jgi:hypothetical protein
MSNAKSCILLRELNVRLLAEIAELKKKFAEIEGKNAEMKLRQELKARTDELEKTISHYSIEMANSTP